MSKDHSEPLSDGLAGKSAQEEYQKRVRAREMRIVKKLGPRLGKILSLIISDNKSTRAWDKGSKGEIVVGELLNELSQELSFFALHDRKIPGSKANIDHIFITDRGIFVIDSKNYQGLVKLKDSGGLFTSKEVLTVGGRDQTKLVEGVKNQVALVENALEKNRLGIPVFGMLAFVDAEFPILFKPTEVDGVLINGKGIKPSILTKPIVSGINLRDANAVLIAAFPAK